MNKLIKKIIFLPRFLRKKYQSHTNVKRLKKITDEVMNLNLSKTAGPKILLGPSFSVYHALKLHDILLTSALAAHGAEITYLSCPFGLPVCNTCGGITQIENSRPELCAYCQRFSRNDAHLIEYLDKYAKILWVQDLVTPETVKRLKTETENIADGELEDYTFEGLPFGKYSFYLVQNEGHVGNIALVPGYPGLVRKTILTNLIFYLYFQKAIEKIRPDIIISHDAFYAPWILLMELAKRYNIPFYNYYSGMRGNTFFYVKNKIANHFDMSGLFEKWKNRVINSKEYKKLDKFFNDRRKLIIYDMKMETIKNLPEFDHYQKLVDGKKPLAVLYTNVLWDLASLNKEVVFSSVQETYFETVRFFVDHPEYTLIVKPHPSDLFHTHESKERAYDLIKTKFPNLPDNILVLRPETSLTCYDLFEKSQASIVYTTTVGIESPIFGKPTITLGQAHYRGRGFTHDPETPEQFFELTTELLNGRKQIDKNREKELATKYYYLLNYVYWYDFEIIRYNFKARSKATVIPKSLSELLQKKEFNTLVEAILNKQSVPYFDDDLAI